ncbi:MAG: excinuclease ABC subunit UvrA [Bacteroidales bacterium]|nr:excinuclease ABC subunit UvrA [Bacteroidales bacterium]
MAIKVLGARVHNLKDIDVTIPGRSLTVITGLSGSGKSSLAFDTIYAEGQRRYIETFSSYARNFLGNMERPDVDKISGLSPVISIEQKTVNRNPRSTVGTTTEIYDFLRLLYSRAGEAYSYLSGEKMVRFSEDKIIELVLSQYLDSRVYLLAPLVRNRKGHYQDLFEQWRKKGYITMRIDGELREILPGMKLDRYKNHSIELVVDKMRVSNIDEQRLRESVRLSMRLGEGMMMILDGDKKDAEGNLCDIRHYSRMLMDPSTGLSYKDPAPHDFSFNSPMGACPHCHGIGSVTIIDNEKIIPDNSLSIAAGGIVPLGKRRKSMIFLQIEALLGTYDCTLDTPIKDIPEDAMQDILNGTGECYFIDSDNAGAGGASMMTMPYEGLVKYIESSASDDASAKERRWAESFSSEVVCPECNGQRLNKEALHFFIDGKNIAEVSNMTLIDLAEWIEQLPSKLNERQQSIAPEIIKEIRSRINFLLGVGIGYLSLNRPSMSLSGGESQRIRLATQIGSQLVNVLYILDEPSIGLHQRDNDLLIRSLKELRDVGNTIIVVEHDKQMMLESDYVIDIGPAAGRKGGNVVFEGKPEELLKTHTLTSDYLNGARKIEVPAIRRKGNGNFLTITGAKGHNLKDITVALPLGCLIGITGVSGSGKSSLINGTLQPILSHHFYRALKEPLPYEKIEGLDNIDKVVDVDQTPIGRTPRSNPATYTGIFSDIRSLFVALPESKIRGYKAGRFSFNVGGGRCEVCGGNGYKTIEMNFLPDVIVPCEGCHGKRYNRETLEVRYKGKSIADVLDMTINQAVEFFENVPHILNKIKVLQEVGLGYIKLGQPSTTLSGGESQRVKLATELSKKSTGKTLYILDEPTTGLHFEDIRVLMNCIARLVDKGNTVIIIEHNLDVIKCCDYIIDMGPDGGSGGGEVVAVGTPEEICGLTDDKKLCKETWTTKYLKQELC